MTEQKRTTACNTSVGADERQSLTNSKTIIPQESILDNPVREIFPEGAGLQSLASLPDEVRRSGRFCCWRYEDRDGKLTKVPYNPLTAERARSNDPSSFCSFEEAAAATEYDGLGIGIFNGICAIDLDNCIVDGEYTATAAEIIQTMHSYTEVSPSGKGVHILFEAPSFQYDTQRFYIMNRARGIEVYVAGATNKYVTVTGKRLNDYDFGDRSEELQTILDRFMARNHVRTKAKSYAGNAINARNSVQAALSEYEILQMARRAKNGATFDRLWNGDWTGYPSHSEADLALCRNLAFWTGKDAELMDKLFRQSGLMRDKWDRPQCGSTYGQITIRQAIEKCWDVYMPWRRDPPVTNAEPAQVRSIEPTPLFQPLKPLTPQSSDLPPFPVESLPATLRDYVTVVAEHSQTSPDMAAVIGLGVLAVCLQAKFVAEGSPGYTEPLSLYTVVIAAPGERKSGVMRDMTCYLYEYEQDYNAAHASEVRVNKLERESLQRQIAALQKKMEQSNDWTQDAQLNVLATQLDDTPELRPKRFFADDCSSEALTSLMVNNGGVFAVMSTEGGIFDLMAGRYSNKVNIDVWLKGHCGDAIYVDRKTREAESILHPALSAILTIQPCVLEEIMSNATMSGRGLIARFLYSSPPSRIGTREFCTAPIPPEVSAAYRNLVYRLMALPQLDEPRRLVLSPDASELLSAYFSYHEKYLVGEGQAISDWACKYIGTVLRVAGLLHAAEMTEDGSPIITEGTMAKAISIGSYFLQHAQYAYSMMGTDLSIQKAKFVMAKLKKKGIMELKRNELFQMCRGKFFKKTEEIFSTLELLEDHGYIRAEQPPVLSAGRPPDVRIVVNPDALEL